MSKSITITIKDNKTGRNETIDTDCVFMVVSKPDISETSQFFISSSPKTTVVEVIMSSESLIKEVTSKDPVIKSMVEVAKTIKGVEKENPGIKVHAISLDDLLSDLLGDLSCEDEPEEQDPSSSAFEVHIPPETADEINRILDESKRERESHKEDKND